jgi:hypothetical protein
MPISDKINAKYHGKIKIESIITISKIALLIILPLYSISIIFDK